MNILEQLPPSVTLTPAQERKMPPEELVMTAIREAVLYTRKCSYGKIPDDALLSLCYETMLKSAALFKPGHLRFFGYCKARLRGEVKRYWKNLETVRNAETVSIDTPTGVYRGKFRRSHNRIVETKTKDYDLHGKWQRPGAEGEDDDELPTAAEIIGGSTEPEFEKIYMGESWERISAVVRRCCNDREWTILYLAYKLQLSFEEIGELLDLSRQFCSAAAAKAIKKLRRVLGNGATI